MKKLNKHKGDIGEQAAQKYLVSHGYEIMAVNYRDEYGEIDIIAAHDGFLVFVEVKSKLSNEYGQPAEEVTAAKTLKISRVAAEYIHRHSLYDTAVRFDVIEVYLSENRIEHIKNAFDSYLRY